MRKQGMLVFLMFLGAISACATEGDPATGSTTEFMTQPTLDADHRRAIQECSQAMWGSWWTHDETNWPSGTTYATYAYTNADIGAWNLMLQNTGGQAKNGTWYDSFYASCMRRRSEGYLPLPYTTCNLSLSTGFGSLEQPYYACQGSCPSSRMHGGQCKPFMNLVAYRSGLYQNPNFAWKPLPSDGCIKFTDCNAIARPNSDPDMPLVPYTSLVPGDFLRQPGGHAAIVVSLVSSTQVIVLDSNFSDGDGSEVISTHTLSITNSGGPSDLAQYRALKCVYTHRC